ncbi:MULTISPECIES: glycoside hydrolase family 52 protein [Suilimivivens]|jgi:xylan 1,4-beta-xylosidase|uniref:Glycoside hydrolase family 52 protein n=2 Tax=Suilimivivens TaxID=2981640 RepID=A0ABT2T1Y1_9FIRM|nr:glycoside hydrolase family 52 protein [Suilimivivens aceti]MCU6744280.1 glycoside hydrolase family 52 protein [Suilimivivens aceti]SCH65302.1 Beta-xylosidase precursor [uncultured Clostridium sp.]
MSTDLFQAIHSPIGANAGFAMGLAGLGGGFCLQSDRIPDQDIFIGYKEGNTLSMLPFYEKSISSEKDSFAKDENGSELQEHAFTEEEVSRGFGLATDTFQTGRLSFSLMNRVTELSDVERGEEPEVKSKALPAIVARFCVDNRDGEQEIQGFFGIGNMKGKQFLSQMCGEERCGVISKDGYGFEAVLSVGKVLLYQFHADEGRRKEPLDRQRRNFPDDEYL